PRGDEQRQQGDHAIQRRTHIPSQEAFAFYTTVSRGWGASKGEELGGWFGLLPPALPLDPFAFLAPAAVVVGFDGSLRRIGVELAALRLTVEDLRVVRTASPWTIGRMKGHGQKPKCCAPS